MKDIQKKNHVYLSHDDQHGFRKIGVATNTKKRCWNGHWPEPAFGGWGTPRCWSSVISRLLYPDNYEYLLCYRLFGVSNRCIGTIECIVLCGQILFSICKRLHFFLFISHCMLHYVRRIKIAIIARVISLSSVWRILRWNGRRVLLCVVGLGHTNTTCTVSLKPLPCSNYTRRRSSGSQPQFVCGLLCVFSIFYKYFRLPCLCNITVSIII